MQIKMGKAIKQKDYGTWCCFVGPAHICHGHIRWYKVGRREENQSLYINGFQKVIPGPAAPTMPGNLIEMQYLISTDTS